MIWLQALFLISSSYYSHSPWFQRTGVAFAGAHRHNTFIQHNLVEYQLCARCGIPCCKCKGEKAPLRSLRVRIPAGERRGQGRLSGVRGLRHVTKQEVCELCLFTRLLSMLQMHWLCSFYIPFLGSGWSFNFEYSFLFLFRLGKNLPQFWELAPILIRLWNVPCSFWCCFSSCFSPLHGSNSVVTPL